MQTKETEGNNSYEGLTYRQDKQSYTAKVEEETHQQHLEFAFKKMQWNLDSAHLEGRPF